MKIIHRIIEYQQFKKLNRKQFEEAVGFTNSYINTTFKRNSDVCEDVILKIIKFDPDLSLRWLILNEGEMYESKDEEIDNSLSEVAENAPEYLTGNILVRGRLIDMIESQQQTIKNLSNVINKIIGDEK